MRPALSGARERASLRPLWLARPEARPAWTAIVLPLARQPQEAPLGRRRHGHCCWSAVLFGPPALVVRFAGLWLQCLGGALLFPFVRVGSRANFGQPAGQKSSVSVSSSGLASNGRGSVVVALAV